MPPRPGDSAPKFDQIDANLAAADNVQPPPSLEDDQGLPDSHVFQMPMAIPHFSDGTTEILKHDRGADAIEAQDPTEPLFPQPVTEPPVVETPVVTESENSEPASAMASEPLQPIDPEATLPV
ncbi:MAG: hypothetical protein ACK5Q5_22820, partial [Planctomycetaceae bacterium]